MTVATLDSGGGLEDGLEGGLEGCLDDDLASCLTGVVAADCGLRRRADPDSGRSGLVDRSGLSGFSGRFGILRAGARLWIRCRPPIGRSVSSDDTGDSAAAPRVR